VLDKKTMIFGDPQRRNRAFIAAWPMTAFREGAAA